MDDKINKAIKYFKLKVVSIEPVEESYSSIVRILQCANGSKVVVKMPFKRRKIEREYKTLKLLEDQLPVPQVLDVWYGNDEIPGALLLSCLPGSPIKNPFDKNLCYEMGKLLAQLHCVKIKGFGEEYEQETTQVNLHELMQQFLSEKLDEFSKVLSADLLKRSINKHNELLASLPSIVEPCLTHNDYKPGNILIDQGNITGLIDFESARGADAARDFCRIKEEVWDVNPTMRQPFLEGYQSIRPLPELEQSLTFYELQNALNCLGWCGQRNKVGSSFWERNMKVLMRIIG